jgi:distribution and morphology protein 12
MSLDINWSLLSDPSTPNQKPHEINGHPPHPKGHGSGNGNGNGFPLDPSSLTTHIITILNTQLSSASRPSFIGPIEITNLDFGSNAPDVEIKDIRDVWRAFDDDDEDEEEEYEEPVEQLEEEYRFDSRRASGRSEYYDNGPMSPGGMMSPGIGNGMMSPGNGMMSPGAGSSRLPSMSMGMAGLGMGMGMGIGMGMDERERDVFDDNASVFSSNRRQSVHAVGLGARGIGLPRAPSIHGHGYAASIISHPMSPGISTRHPALTHTHISHPPSPARPPIKPKKSTPSAIPSIQLHINLTHTSDLTLTLLTSLTVHYPASVFMSLPLKLSITGLQLAADIILAFDGEKNRVHLTILDEGDEEGVPVGMRLLPEMRIDSEIGHSDAHVLRNVGKIERFIADVVRKTLVDELVFPNFHTIAL